MARNNPKSPTCPHVQQLWSWRVGRVKESKQNSARVGGDERMCVVVMRGEARDELLEGTRGGGRWSSSIQIGMEIEMRVSVERAVVNGEKARGKRKADGIMMLESSEVWSAVERVVGVGASETGVLSSRLLTPPRADRRRAGSQLLTRRVARNCGRRNLGGIRREELPTGYTYSSGRGATDQ